MKEVKPPEDFRPYIGTAPSMFLAGSIEMGKAEDWQERIVSALKHVDCVILNPRRANWDASWEQSIDNPYFKGQVDWELDALDAADHVVFYFAPTTKAPVTLLELGLRAAKRPDNIIVCCPDGYWRKGNVDITCRRAGVFQVPDLQSLTREIVLRIAG
jgi:hypothetical protein